MAAHLGYFNVEEMLASAPAGQLMLWRRHYEKNPYDWDKATYGFVQLINYLKYLEMVYLQGKKPELLKEKDFMPEDALVPKFKKQSEKEEEQKPKKTMQMRMKEMRASFMSMVGIRK